MNKERRKELNKAVEMLNSLSSILYDATDIVETCKGEEEEYRDNMPENLQGSDRYSMADEACDCLDNALDSLSDVTDTINDIIESIENAME